MHGPIQITAVYSLDCETVPYIHSTVFVYSEPTAVSSHLLPFLQSYLN